MLGSVDSFIGYGIRATDGEIGKVDDLLFDDKTWGTAYLVVKMGGLFDARKVLLPPTALGRPDWEKREFPVAYSVEQVNSSPDINLDKPVSRQREEELYKYYGWAPYWLPNGEFPMGAVAFPVAMEELLPPETSVQESDPHLHSMKEVIGYRVQANDGKVGYVEDGIVNDATWAIPYIVVSTTYLLPGKKALIFTNRIHGIVWAEEKVDVDFTMDTIKNSPDYIPSTPVNEDYEELLHEYYKQPNESKTSSRGHPVLSKRKN